eukprot:8545687-Pyramimonas_sp.AAC.1
MELPTNLASGRNAATTLSRDDHPPREVKLKLEEKLEQVAKQERRALEGDACSPDAFHMEELRRDLLQLRDELRDEHRLRRENGSDVDSLRQENASLKEQIHRVTYERDKAELTLQEVRREAWVTSCKLQELQANLEGGGSAQRRDLQERVKVALEARAEEVQELHSRNLHLQRANASLKADLASWQADLRSKERQLQVYEDGLAHSLDTTAAYQLAALPVSQTSTPLRVGTPSYTSAGANTDIVAQLRTIMSEAYIINMALKKHSDLAGSQICGALGDWVLATHALKKEVLSSKGEEGNRTRFEAFI